MSTELLECGHPESPHSDITRGYGTDEHGKRRCYQCCADKDRASMIETGRATLYLLDNGPRTRVTNWPGSLEFQCYPRVAVSRNGGGFGSQRTDAWFAGPDGYVWHAINRGDSQIARCKRTKERVRK